MNFNRIGKYLMIFLLDFIDKWVFRGYTDPVAYFIATDNSINQKNKFTMR